MSTTNLNQFLKFAILGIALLTTNFLTAQITGPIQVCEGEVVNYNTSVAGANYIWQVSGAVQSVSNSNQFDVTWGGSGSGYVLLVVKNQSGLQIYSDSINVSIVNKPNAVFTPNFFTSCRSITEPPSDSCIAACQFTPMRYHAEP